MDENYVDYCSYTCMYMFDGHAYSLWRLDGGEHAPPGPATVAP